MIYINLFSLMFVAFIPFVTNLLFSYPAQFVSVTIFAELVAAMGLTIFWLWFYSTRNRRMVGKETPQSTIRGIGKGLLITPTVFLVSIDIAFFNP